MSLAYETPDPEQVPTEQQLEEETPGGHASAGHDPYAAWRFRNYRFYVIGSFLAVLGGQLQATAITYEIANRTPDERQASLLVGLAALVQGLPVLLLALPAGQMADRFDRRLIALLGTGLAVPGSLWLAWLSQQKAAPSSIYVCLFVLATISALTRPAQSALLPQLVPTEVMANAVTWNSTRWQIASVAGPALFGPMLALFHDRIAWIYLFDAFALALFFVFMLFLRPRPQEHVREAMSLSALVAGVRFVFGTKLILATLTLDLFAVLLGGAVVMLPIYAKHVLHIGPTELGWLRAAPAVGAVIMALLLAHLPPMRRAGLAMLWAVVGFGVATIVFGWSKNYWLSLFALAMAGAFDNISVVVRHTLVQLLTPDSMRGRVSAVNSVFISASNEFGGFESGVVGAWLGPVKSVIYGGIGTVLVVGATALKWPEMTRLGRLQDVKPAEDKSTPTAH